MEGDPREPIAIVGMGCRFPGADNPSSLWELFRNGVDAITEVPPDRFEIDEYYDPEVGKPGKVITRWGGFLSDVDRFDADFFGITPREAESMDPQQRVLMELAYEALEDGGIPLESIAGSNTGVFIGIAQRDYSERMLMDGNDPTAYFGTGQAHSVAANRISYTFDLHGPSLAVDTACSSSLVALQLAIQSLRRGECDLALVGGVNLVLAPLTTIGFSQAHMMSSEGRCKTFDDSADGYVRSDGSGMVVLKRLSDAMRDGNVREAVIRGAAMNEDGRTNGIMAPNGRAQQAVIRLALEDAGLKPTDIDYVEAHGTGTPLGDPLEMDALKAVLTEGRPPDHPLFVGSGKTNIGHSEAAAGIAGLIRAVLILQHHMVPPHLHLRTLNPAIDLEGVPLRIAQVATPLNGSGPLLRVGVNSFGFGGANCHVILEEAAGDEPATNVVPTRPEILTLSARSPEALTATAVAYRESLAQWNDSATLHDVCAAAALHRTHHDERLALVADSRDGMIDLLQAFEQGDRLRAMSQGSAGARHGKMAFVFAGMGTQWIGMGRRLLEGEPVFRTAIERCDAAMSRYVDWSVIAEMMADGEHCRLDDIGILQPVLFAIAIGLADLWRSWGIEPEGVVGHSVGEIAAACVAGIVSLDDAAHIVCTRAAALRPASGHGAMLSVGLSVTDVARVLEGYEGRVVLALVNSPTSVVLSGDPGPLDEIAARLDGEGIFCRPVKSDIAFHSPHMDPLYESFSMSMGQIPAREGTVPMYSTVTAGRKDGPEFDASYWIRNFREPVNFAGTIEQMLVDGYDTFLEVSPHSVLVHVIKETAAAAAQNVVALPSLRRNEVERQMMLQTLGELYVRGWHIEWDALFEPEGRRVTLPSYPWQRERFWMEPRSGGRVPRRRSGGHPFVGHQVISAAHAGKRVWEIELDFDAFPYLADHTVGASPVFPAAGFVEMSLAVAQALGPGPHVVENLVIEQGLLLAADQTKTVQVVVTSHVPGTEELQFLSRDAAELDGQESWAKHATATVRTESPELHRAPDSAMRLEEFESSADNAAADRQHRPERDALAVRYGPAFSCIDSMHWSGNEAVGRIHLPAAAGSADGYNLHPVLLDAGLQICSAVGSLERYMPARIEAVRMYKAPAHGLWVHSIRRPGNKYAEEVAADIHFYNADGQMVADLQGVCWARRKLAADEAIEDWLYETRWDVAKTPAFPDTQGLPADWHGSWLILDDGREVGRCLASLLEARGQPCTLVTPGDRYRNVAAGQYQVNPVQPADFRRLVDEAFASGPPLKGIVHLWSGEVPSEGELSPAVLQDAQDLGCISVMNLVQAINAVESTDRPRLWLVTRGAQSVGGLDTDGLAQSPLLGLARVLDHELPEYRCTRIDLDAADRSGRAELLLAEMLADEREDEVAYRDGTRYVQRIVRHVHESQVVTEPKPMVTVTADTHFRLGTLKAGVLDNLQLNLTRRETPGPRQMEIKVVATGLNFRDVMSAMGMLPGYPDGLGPLGYECAGVVVAVGPDVSEFQVGDEVVACAQHAFASYVTVDVDLAALKPRRISFEEAVTIPVTFLTAYYALQHLARIQPGETVLIHAAAGGVGLAAVQIAKAAGATIFATAGSTEKREYLLSLGVTQVMDSRSLNFADEVMKVTSGRGVDIVLNSLAGEFIEKSLSVLAPYGRFLEIGRRDIYGDSQIGLFPFQRNLSFFAIDLDRVQRERPELGGALLRAIMARVEDGSLSPLPTTVFPITQAADAFRYMAQAKHIGKIVISMNAEGAQIQPVEGSHIEPDATYLITGAFGGIGLELTRWMVEQGAKSLVLVGRRGPAPDAEPALESLRQMGCTITTARVDVAREEELAGLLADIRESLPPLRGVIHAAGVLDDSILMSLNRDRFTTVMAPKVSGAWNLHRLTRGDSLDFFVLFSSLAGVLGSAGQGNYAAANQFLDSLADFRRARGLPALSIAWGPWSDVGMGAGVDLLDRFAAQGVVAIPPHHGFEILGRLLRRDVTRVLAARIQWKRWLHAHPDWESSPFLSPIMHDYIDVPSAEASSSDPLQALSAVSEEGRQNALETYLCDQAGKVMGISSRKISVQQSLAGLGLDSLMAVELRNRIRSDLNVTVPTKAFLEGVAIEQVATMVLMQLFASEAVSTNGHLAGEELEEITL